MHRIIILAGLVVMLVTSCKKNHDPAPDYYVSAKKNGVNWLAAQPNIYIFKDTLNIWGTIGNQSLGIRIKPASGLYDVQHVKANFYTLAGFDVVESEYRLTTNTANAVNITTFSLTDNYVEGSFSLTFEKVKGPASAPATITFTNGLITGLISEPHYRYD